MKTIKMSILKTTMILAACLGLQINTTFAASNKDGLPVSNITEFAGTNSMLMPATPAVATFEDFAEMNQTMVNIPDLIPVLPMVGEFNDGAPTSEINLINLAPVTPKEADFEDEPSISSVLPVRDVAPVTPADADFEDQV